MDIFSSIEEEASEQLNLSGESGNNGSRNDRNGSKKIESKKKTIKKALKDINNRNSGSEESVANEGNDEAEEGDDEIDDEMKCKLDSKSKALLILSQDLVSCQRERDEYKMMAEQIRDKYSRLKKVLLTTSTNQLMSAQGMTCHPSSLPVTQVLLELTDQNKFLLFEVEELKAKLTDSESDLKMLREQLRNLRNIQRFQDGDDSFGSIRTESRLSNRGLVEEAVLEQLETFRSKVLLMERDLQLILEEKEELICSRDNYKRKVQRLNQQLNQLSNSKNDQSKLEESKSSILDIDSVVTENLFLKEKLKALEEEKRLNISAMNKYKVLLEKSSKGGYNNILNSITRSLNPVSSMNQVQQYKISENEAPITAMDIMSPTTQVISSKQIQSFITSHELNNLPVNEHSINRLRSLLLALFEAFCDKSSALIIHKKNNKLLGRRINELEDKIRELMAKEKVLLLTSRDLRLDEEIERHTRELDSRIELQELNSRMELSSSFDDSRVSSSLTASNIAVPVASLETRYGNPDHDQDLEDIDRVIQSLRAEVERVGIDDEERWRVKDELNHESSIDTDVDVARMDIGSEMRATTEVIAKEVGSLSGTSRTSSSSSEYSDPDASDSRERFLNPDRRRIVMRRQTERIDDDELTPSDYI